MPRLSNSPVPSKIRHQKQHPVRLSVCSAVILAPKQDYTFVDNETRNYRFHPKRPLSSMRMLVSKLGRSSLRNSNSADHRRIDSSESATNLLISAQNSVKEQPNLKQLSSRHQVRLPSSGKNEPMVRTLIHTGRDSHESCSSQELKPVDIPKVPVMEST